MQGVTVSGGPFCRGGYWLNWCVSAGGVHLVTVGDKQKPLSQRHKFALAKSKIWTLTYLSGEPEDGSPFQREPFSSFRVRTMGAAQLLKKSVAFCQTICYSSLGTRMSAGGTAQRQAAGYATRKGGKHMQFIITWMTENLIIKFIIKRRNRRHSAK